MLLIIPRYLILSHKINKKNVPQVRKNINRPGIIFLYLSVGLSNIHRCFLSRFLSRYDVKAMFSILLYFKNSFIFFWWVRISSQFHSAQDSRLPILSLHACSMIMNFSEATATNLIFPDSVSR